MADESLPPEPPPRRPPPRRCDPRLPPSPAGGELSASLSSNDRALCAPRESGHDAPRSVVAGVWIRRIRSETHAPRQGGRALAAGVAIFAGVAGRAPWPEATIGRTRLLWAAVGERLLDSGVSMVVRGWLQQWRTRDMRTSDPRPTAPRPKDIKAVAEELGVSVSGVRRLIKRGELPATRRPPTPYRARRGGQGCFE